MKDFTEAAVVGAGPYGLSIAAHLRGLGIEHRVFGRPMHTWCNHMPDGMFLKSDGFASNLSDPKGEFTLQRFCAARGIPYDHTRVPVRIETFREYGLAFQKAVVPHLEDREVTSIEQGPDAYQLRLSTGESFAARNVILAVGISHFQYLPPALRQLGHAVSHSSDHKELERFRGRSVSVIGGGASAIDLAVLLKEAGADVTLIARQPELTIHNPPGPNQRTLMDQIRRPSSPIGPGWRARLLTEAPALFRQLPVDLRLRIVRRFLGPAAGWPMKERFANVPTLLGYSIESATANGGGVHLHLRGADGAKEHVSEHVIAATGYRANLRRLGFLSDEILARLSCIEQTPALSSHFESSCPGLYFVGLSAANSFGPMMRFACGAEWTAARLARRIARKRRQ